MAKDFNKVHLCGVIGDDFKYGRTSEGVEFATFSLCINSYEKEYDSLSERTHSQVYVRIFVNDKRQIEYLRNVNAGRGQRLFIYGMLTSYRNEYKGISFITLSVVSRDLGIIKTR